jgi:MSHA pilin protein MshD
MSTSSRSQSGFTLIELIIFIVVVSIGMAGILTVMNTTVKSSADPMVRKQALAIAESLLEEIVQKEYAKPTGSTVVGYPTAGWSRALFDCVDDYNGYTVSGVTDAAGNAVAGLANYSISPAVVVSPVSLSGQSLKKVVVTVTGPQGTISLSGYRGIY